ncbi:MAG TPA: sulfatase, partial [Polyangia bacterium]
VFVNEQAVGTVEVPATLSDVTVPVPGKLLTLGENRLRLMFRAAAPLAGGGRSPAAISQIAIGAAGRGAIPPRSALTAETRPAAGDRRGFVVPAAGRLSFFVQVPANAKLVTGYAAADNAANGANIAVRITRDGTVPRTLFEGPAGALTEAGWDLTAEAGYAARIDFLAQGGAVFWAAPRLALPEAKIVPPPEKHFDNIFVWMVDTLRADKVRAFNPKTRVETPNYDAFAADATRFAWAQVPGTWSLPSHSSILTGVYPSVHKATAHTARLSREVPFVAELMKKGGYKTGLFSSNGYVSGKWGFDRGWDEVRNFIRESLPNGAEYLWKTARTWLDLPGNKGKPTFLYLATVEPHVIYNPRKEFLERYWKKPYTGPIKPNQSGVQLGYIKSGKLKINDNDKKYLEALHDAEITQSDAAFGAFLADLKARNVYDKTAIIVISDHGDEFWEHGDVGHAQGVYQELVHIPLIVRAPGVFPTGKVVEADVEAMDVFPTMLDLAGLPVPPGTQGMSLLPLAIDEATQSPRVSLTQNLDINRGIKSGRYRLVHPGLGRAEIYDEIDDPLEQKNLASTHPIAMRQLRNTFGLLHANENRWRKRAWGTAANLLEGFYTPAADAR